MGGEADLLADLAHHVAECLGALLPAEGLAAIQTASGVISATMLSAS